MKINDSEFRNGVLIEFLEVAIHNILFYSNIYPDNVFTRKKKYAISVQICKQPKINEYIKQCLNSSKHLLQLRQLHKIIIEFYDNFNLTCQFSFVIKQTENMLKSDPYLFKAEGRFREFLLKMPSIQKYFKNPVSGEAYFKILLIATERGYVEMTHNDAFQQYTFIQTEESDSNFAIVPISTEFPVGVIVYAGVPN